MTQGDKDLNFDSFLGVIIGVGRRPRYRLNQAERDEIAQLRDINLHDLSRRYALAFTGCRLVFPSVNGEHSR